MAYCYTFFSLFCVALGQYLTVDGDAIRHGRSRSHIIRPLKHNVYEYLTKVSDYISENSSSVVNDEPYVDPDPQDPLERSTRATDELEVERQLDEEWAENVEDVVQKRPVEVDIVTRFLRIVETQQQLGENCSAGTDLSLGEGVVDRYAQERFRVEADVAVNRANMWTRLWKYAEPSVLHSEYLLHSGVVSIVEFDDDIFAAGNCYDQYQYKDYSLFCAYAFRLPDGPILAKNLAVEYKYMNNATEWFFIARKSAERIIHNHDQFRKGFNAYTHNDTAHGEWVPDEILSVKYEDGKWSKPYYDCGGGNIWMLTYTVPFFGYKNNTYFFKGTSGIDIDLRRVDIDQCPLAPDNQVLNIFAGSDKCKKRTTMCVAIPGLGFRRGSYKCLCRRGFYYPDTKAQHRFYNGTIIEDEYEKLILGEDNRYSQPGTFECLQCAEGCDVCIDSRPCIVSLNWVMRTIILVMSCVIILFLPVIVFFTWKYGNVKVVRAASPVLLRFITLGAFFIYCTPIVMYPTPNLGTCTVRVWLREIGFSLTYGALMLKTWRISVIFHVRSAKPVRITDMDLLKRLGIIVGVFCVFLVIRTLVAPPVVITGRTADDLKAYLCRTDWWDHSFTSMEVVFLIWGIRLCIVVRKAPSEFNEARFISMAIYNEFLLTVFLKVSMLFLQSPANPDLLYIIFFCHTQLTVTLLLCLIFGSKVYIVFRDQGRLEEQSGTVSKAQTTTFLTKAKSGNSQQNPSSQSSTVGRQDVIQDVEKELQVEFQRVCVQLEALKETHRKLGNHSLIAKISAMQEAARRDFSNKALEEPKINSVNNTKVSENPLKGPEVIKNSFNESARARTDEASVSAKRRSLKSKTLCEACGGVAKLSDKEERVCLQECHQCRKKVDHATPSGDGNLRYGHAKTHSIVINLDDSNRFTEEVTV